MCMYGPHAWNRRRVSRARTSLHRSWPRVVRCPAPGAGPPARYAPAAATGVRLWGASPAARARGGGALAETRRPRSVVRRPSTSAHRGVRARSSEGRAQRPSTVHRGPAKRETEWPLASGERCADRCGRARAFTHGHTVPTQVTSSTLVCRARGLHRYSCTGIRYTADPAPARAPMRIRPAAGGAPLRGGRGGRSAPRVARFHKERAEGRSMVARAAAARWRRVAQAPAMAAVAAARGRATAAQREAAPRRVAGARGGPAALTREHGRG